LSLEDDVERGVAGILQPAFNGFLRHRERSSCRGMRRKRRIRWASWVGPVSRIAASFEPRGVNAKLGCNLSENTTSCQNEIVSQGTDANEAARRRFNACDTADSRREFFSLIVRTFRRRRPQKRAPVIFRG
jgi:hypothetical protein